jgi:hypothetical protein
MQKNIYFSLFLFSICIASFAQGNFNITIQKYLQENVKELSSEDISELKIYNEIFSESNNLHHVYTVQRINGVPVFNATGNFAIKNEKVNFFANNFISNIADKVNASSPNFTALQAVQKAANQLGLNASSLEILETNGNNAIISKGGISLEDIPVKLVYQPIDDELKLAWDLSIHMTAENHWWSLRIDALTGKIIHQNDWALSCNFHSDKSKASAKHTKSGFGFKNTNTNLLNDGSTYNIYPLNINSPNLGSRQIVTEPASVNASPFGWHDTDGSTGAEFTTTRGNNAWAYENRDGDDNTGYSPDGGSNLNFNFPLNLNQNPEGYIDASVTNLFYWNNMMHDVWYEYGFDEQSGNFQSTNYSSLGLENDFVFARAQDGANFGPGNNATFGTPPDGSSPVMRMFTWSANGGAPQVLEINAPGPLQGTYTGSTANFGPNIPSDGVTGDFVLVTDNNISTADPYDACDPITNANTINGKIAIIKRGECTFTSKVQKAQDNGAIAVIIVNDEFGLINMDGESNSINILSIMVTSQDGNAIINSLVNGTTINGTIQEMGPFPKDGDLDGEIVAHEYGHGISNRLTGGSFNSNCLFSCAEVDDQGNCIQFTEQMGEGWSDYFALAMTLKPGDMAEDARTIASYSSGNLGGLRSAPYSTDFAINNFTYGNTNNTSQLSAPHGVGFVWATMLWDLTWALIDEHGYDSDIYNGTGGNNIAMQLVIDGLKLQNCNPGFVDGRDAILQADIVNNNGENQCLIWSAFANRGLGFSASQGDSLDRTDQSEAFDLPPTNVLDCSLGTSSTEIKNFTIYPNPAEDYVTIESRKNLNNISVEVYDINGRKVIAKDLMNNSLDVSQLSQGIYIIRINADELTQTEKLIIK